MVDDYCDRPSSFVIAVVHTKVGIKGDRIADRYNSGLQRRRIGAIPDRSHKRLVYDQNCATKSCTTTRCTIKSVRTSDHGISEVVKDR